MCVCLLPSFASTTHQAEQLAESREVKANELPVHGNSRWVRFWPAGPSEQDLNPGKKHVVAKNCCRCVSPTHQSFVALSTRTTRAARIVRTYNIHPMLAQNIVGSDYFKSLHEYNNFLELVDEIYTR
jgi:PRP38 family